MQVASFLRVQHLIIMNNTIQIQVDNTINFKCLWNNRSCCRINNGRFLQPYELNILLSQPLVIITLAGADGIIISDASDMIIQQALVSDISTYVMQTLVYQTIYSKYKALK